MSTQSAAQVEYELQDIPLSIPAAPASALKLQTAERLAAHRARRSRPGDAMLTGLDLPARPQADTRAARIAAAVAERYAQSQSYRAFLAAEAERAIEQAEAAAEVAARTARAVAASHQQLLDELEGWEPIGTTAPLAPTLVESPIEQTYYEPAEEPSYYASEIAQASLTVRLYEDVGRSPGTGRANAVPLETLNEDDRLALDEEIAFRQAPSFEQFLEPSTPLAANLIEFPRQLIASRKARPRLAEGPLREDGDHAPDNAQLRIFEVEADQISILPVSESTLPEWSSIRLDATPVADLIDLAQDPLSYAAPIDSASLGLRVMSCAVDCCIIAATFVGFATVAAKTAGQLPTGQGAAIAGGVSLFTLALMYQLLFFTLSDATPGMRYARIALCTFSDENPTRSAMRRRIIANLLAACPIGLGFAWAWLDDEKLGWHDRISRMYQRSY